MPLKVEEEVVPSSSSFRPGLYLAKYAYSGMVKASKIIADSECTRRDIEKYFDCAGKVRVIYPGVASIYSVANEQEKLEAAIRFGLSDSGVYYLLNVGGVDGYKNIEGLLHAFAILTKDLQLDAYLIRVGANLTSVQRSLAAKLGVSDKLIELGRLSDNDLRLVYNLADVLLFASFYEGFGWPPLEAMACGTSVVVSTAPSLLEVVGDAALAVAPSNHRGMAEAVQAVLTNQELRTRMIAKGLERAKMFSWDKTAARVLNVYLEVLEEKQLLDAK